MEVDIMANVKREWENIYKDYVKSGLTRGEFIKKHQLSTYAFEKFKKLDDLHNKIDRKSKNEAIFVPAQVVVEKEDSDIVARETNSLVLSSGKIQIVVTEETSQKLLLNVLKAISELC